METGTQVAVWMNDDGARSFLGAPQASRVSRWVARGLVESLEPPVGFWLSVDGVQEWKADGKRIDWSAASPLCLIRWESVITIQMLGEKTSQIGFAMKPAGSRAGVETTKE